MAGTLGPCCPGHEALQKAMYQWIVAVQQNGDDHPHPLIPPLGGLFCCHWSEKTRDSTKRIQKLHNNHLLLLGHALQFLVLKLLYY
jgi:hypothetical protein